MANFSAWLYLRTCENFKTPLFHFATYQVFTHSTVSDATVVVSWNSWAFDFFRRILLSIDGMINRQLKTKPFTQILFCLSLWCHITKIIASNLIARALKPLAWTVLKREIRAENPISQLIIFPFFFFNSSPSSIVYLFVIPSPSNPNPTFPVNFFFPDSTSRVSFSGPSSRFLTICSTYEFSIFDFVWCTRFKFQRSISHPRWKENWAYSFPKH